MKTPIQKLALLTFPLIISILLANLTATARTINGIEIIGSAMEESIELESTSGKKHERSLTIRNSTKESATLELYLHRAELEGKSFELVGNTFVQDDLIDWIKLSKNSITLAPGAETTVPFTVAIPENAGIGKHAGAIMARQRIDDGNGGIVNLDTGIRVLATIKGETALTKYKLINSRQHEESGKLSYQSTIVNNGNTVLKGEIKLNNLAHGPSEIDRQQIRLNPGEEQKIHLRTERTPIGRERIITTFNINHETKTFVLQDGFRLPLAEALGLLLFCAFIWLIITSSKTCPKTSTCSNCRNKTLAALLVITALSAGIINSVQTEGRALQANIFGPDEQAFLTTIKWGSFRGSGTATDTFTAWQGQFSIENGQIDEIEKLHNEVSDDISVTPDQKSIVFRNYTGPDNDGIIVLIRTPANENATLTMRNNLSGEEIKIPLASTLKKARLINYKNQQIQIVSEPATFELIEQIDAPPLTPPVTTTTTTPAQDTATEPETLPSEDTMIPIVEIESTLDNTILITDLESSPDLETLVEEDLLTDLESTEEIDTLITEETAVETTDPSVTEELLRLMAEIKLLTGLIRELPASPDVISEYILSSDFISSITSDSVSTTIVGSSRLIRTLRETPLIIREITATPDTNYLFLPNDRVKLATQTFSFSERKSSSQEMNEIIFVQKRSTPWTVYFSISDLTALSGNGSIPASNVTFNPGTISIISQSGETPQVQAGAERKLTSQGDLAKVFTVIPADNDVGDGNNLTIFSARPNINVFIPPKTLPGLYRGEITFKAI